MTRARRAIAVAAVALFVLAGAARGHIVYGRPTLLGLVAAAERVAHVRIVDPDAVVALEETGEQRPVIVAELREALKGGGAPGEVLRFATHGHGTAGYEKGEQALVFLAPLESSRELRALQGTVDWISYQEHDARYLLTPENRGRLLGAARAYVAVETLPGPAARVEALRRVTVDLITSGDPRLAAGAVQDLAIAENLPLVTAEDVPRLTAEVVAFPQAPIGVRVALLSELGRRGLVESTPLWLSLLRTTPKPDGLQVIRVAGRQPGAFVGAELVGLLASEDPQLAAAAALALGHPRHAAATASLARALERPEPRVRMAAIRGLGGIATQAALEALRTAAEDHADPATRRRAAAEAQKLER